MNWFTIGAAIIAALFVLNALVYVFHTKKRRAAAGKATGQSMAMPMAGFLLGVMVFILAAWGACLVSTVVAPESFLGQAMARPWALASLFVWLLAGAVIVVSFQAALSRRRGSSTR